MNEMNIFVYVVTLKNFLPLRLKYTKEKNFQYALLLLSPDRRLQPRSSGRKICVINMRNSQTYGIYFKSQEFCMVSNSLKIISYIIKPF